METVARLGGCENSAPGNFCSGKLEKSQPTDVCPVPGGTSRPPSSSAHPPPSAPFPVAPWFDLSGLSDQREQNLKGILLLAR